MWRKSSHRSQCLVFCATEKSLPIWDNARGGSQCSGPCKEHPYSFHNVAACFVLISCHLGAGWTRLCDLCDEAPLHEVTFVVTGELERRLRRSAEAWQNAERVLHVTNIFSKYWEFQQLGLFSLTVYQRPWLYNKKEKFFLLEDSMTSAF